jgi:hypothetical protein
MPSFDYITSKEFRESLESDHSEMRKCADVQAWKSVQVLAGSIVESLLVDYIVSTTNASKPSKDPLKMDLGEAIMFCRNEKVLSDRTADLCSVIRSYRNLIHPGRMVRLDEQPPDKGSSTIALALVDIIAEELARVRRTAVGLTAEQILSKVQRDANSLTILKHLLQEANELQRERLLIELIPSAHIEATGSENPHDVSAERLEGAYRIILESVSHDVRKRVASEFVRVLREEDGGDVLRYGEAFFIPADIEFVPQQHKEMVREHLLGRVPNLHTLSSLRLLEGIGEYLQPSDDCKWLDPIIRTLSSNTVRENVKQKTREYLLDEASLTSDEFNVAVDKRLDAWIKFYEERKSSENAESARELKKDLNAQRLPF